MAEQVKELSAVKHSKCYRNMNTIDYSGGQATGRFTNGRAIGDFICVNYASGGTGFLNDTGLYFIQRLSFDDHINNFKKTKEVISANIGEAAANKHFNEATYFIGIDKDNNLIHSPLLLVMQVLRIKGRASSNHKLNIMGNKFGCYLLSMVCKMESDCIEDMDIEVLSSMWSEDVGTDVGKQFNIEKLGIDQYILEEVNIIE
ncbi:hypothetical protein JHK82_018840 [Glycine max]|nr:hypothetical protein JHK82_018840 [Glycine max]